MANAFSILHNFDQPLYTPDFNLIQQGLAYKQQKVDVNREKLQNLYDQFSILQVSKDVDQQYIEKRLQDVKEIANNYASQDLSDDSFANSMMANIGQVLDDKVKNAIYSTKVIQAKKSVWDKARTEGKENYNSLNEEWAWANSDLGRYMNSEETGDVFRGGGDFKEYININKIFSDNIPKMEKVLGAKWIERGDKEGYFETLETHEGIPRAKISALFESILDDKALGQMRINAWGTYDKLPDQVVKRDWENFYNSDKNQLKNEISNLKLVKADPRYKAESGKYESEIRLREQMLSKMEDRSYDDFVKTNGKENAYGMLYKDKFKKNILDTYSSDNITDIKVNEAQKESLYYGLKLRDQANADAKTRAYLTKTGLEITKLKNEIAGSTTSQGQTYGDIVAMESDEKSQINYMKQYSAKKDMHYNNMLSMLKKNGISDSEARKALNSPEILTQFKNLAGKKSIEVAGKKIDIVANNKTILDYTNTFVNESGTDKMIHQGIQGMLGDIQNTLADAKDVNIYRELPNFNFQIKNGKYVYNEYQQGSHNYAYLVKQKQKGEISKDQEATLNLYTALHVFNDPNISRDKKVVTKEYITTLMSQMDPSVARSIDLSVRNKPGERIRNSHTSVDYGLNRGTRDQWLTDMSRRDVNRGAKNITNQTLLNTVGALSLPGSPSYTEEQANLIGAVGTGLNTLVRSGGPILKAEGMAGLDRVIEDGFTGIVREIEKAEGLTSNVAEVREIIYDPKNPQYNKILDLAGITDTKYNRKIKLVPITSGYVPTGDYKVEFEQKSTETGKTSQWIPAPEKMVTGKELETRQILKSDFSRNNRFDARRPEYAASLDLGNNLYDEDKHLDFANSPDPRYRSPQLLITSDAKKLYIDAASELGESYRNQMKQVLRSFTNGEYTFKLNPKKDNTYHLDIYRGNNKFFSVPTGETSLDEKVPTLLSDPREYIEYGFNEFLKSNLKKMQEQYIDNEY